MARLFNDAASQYLRLSASLASIPMSLSAWVYIDDDSAKAMGIISIGTVVAVHEYCIQTNTYTTNKFQAVTVDSGGTSVASTTSGLTINTWHHCLGVFSATDARAVYVDGGSKGTNAVSRTPAGLDRTTIGVRSRNPLDYYLSGRVAEVAIWSAALTDAEAAVLAKGYSPLLVRPQSLVAYWPLIRDTDDDIVGGYSMTPVNAPTVAAHPRVLYPTGYRVGIPEVGGAPAIWTHSQAVMIG